MDNDKILLYKLNIIFLKMQDGVTKMDNDKDFIKICHQSHIISWLLLQQILPKVDKDYSGLLKSLFQLMTQISKYGIERFQIDNDLLIVNMFQQRLWRQRSVEFSDCELCGRQMKLGKFLPPKRREIFIEKIAVPQQRKELNRPSIDYRAQSQPYLQEPILTPQNAVQAKIGPINSQIDNSIAEVRNLLSTYQNGGKVLNMNDRERLKKQLIELEDKRLQIEGVEEQLTNILNMEQDKKKQRLSFIKMLKDDIGKLQVDVEIQTDLGMSMFSQIKDQMAALDGELKRRDDEIAKLTITVNQQQRALESLGRKTNQSNVVSMTNISGEQDTMGALPATQKNQNRNIRNSMVAFRSPNEHSVQQGFPSEAVQELREILRQYLLLRHKGKEAVSLLTKLYQDCPGLTQSIKGLTNPEAIRSRALKIIESIQELLKQSGHIKDTIMGITAMPIKDFASQYLKQNLPSVTLMMQQIMLLEQVQQAKLQRIPFYDPLFDPEFIDGSALTLRTTNVNGDEIVEECIVEVVSGKEIRARQKPLQQRNTELAESFFNQDDFIVQALKVKKPAMLTNMDTQQWTDERGRKIRLIGSTAEEDIFEIIEDNEGENPFRHDRVKIMKINKKNKSTEEKWEFIDPEGFLHIKKIISNDAELICEDQVYVKGQISRVITNKVVHTNGADVVLQEIHDEVSGQQIFKSLKKIQFGQDLIETQVKDKKGKLLSQMSRQIVQEKENDLYLLQLELDEGGKQTSKLIRKYMGGDQQDDFITEEKITTPEGVTSLIKTIRRKDFNGKDQIEIISNDHNGDETALKQREYNNEQGQLVSYQELVNMRTQQQDIIVSFVNNVGQKVEEVSVMDKDGNVIETKNVLYVNDTETTEKRIDINRNTYHTTTKNLDEKKHVDEIKVDDEGNQTRTTKQFYRKNNADVEEVAIYLSNGLKTHNIVSTVTNDDGSKVVEEERQDQFGQKIFLKKTINKRGEQIVEEFEVDNKSGMTKIRQYVIRSPDDTPAGERSPINSYRDPALFIVYGDKQTQTLPIAALKGQVCHQCKKRIDSQASQRQGNSRRDMKLPEQLTVKVSMHQKNTLSATNATDQHINLDDVDDQMFKKVDAINQNPKYAKVVKEIRSFLNLQEGEVLSMDDFKYYMTQMRQQHQDQGCGLNCTHLQRFYNSLGVLIQKQINNREALKMQYISIHAKPKSNAQLPDLDQFAMHK